MKRPIVSRLFLLCLLAVTAAGCSVATGIFRAGFWSGIIVVVLVVVGIVFLVSKARR